MLKANSLQVPKNLEVQNCLSDSTSVGSKFVYFLIKNLRINHKQNCVYYLQIYLIFWRKQFVF